MSSILTNNSAMVALQTLKSINSNLANTQAEISTGKAIGSAKDNAAVWAISKVMEADVKGFKGISESLSLGESTVAVARQASETVTDLLTEIKGKIVAAQEDNVDRAKIQTDIVALRDQITSVVGAAQFNGLNLVDGTQSGTNSNGNVGVDVLSSLDRKSDGSVVTSSIGVDAQNLSLTAGTDLAAAAASVGTDTGTAGVIDANDGGTNDSITLDTFAFLDASGGATATSAVLPNTAGVDTAVNTGLVVGDQLSLTVGTVQGNYVVKEGDTAESVVAGMKNAMVAAGLDSGALTMDIDSNAGQLVITNETNADIAFSFEATRGSGGLSDLGTIDVSTSSGADAALGAIENMIQTSIDASASFGSVEGRIEIQSDFVGKLSDSLKSGIGALVDADMEATSAKLQALQVQQQLGTQALSIANQAPQNILSLFR
ncbi:flagellin [Aliiroseovarius sp. S253]|uniref:flagellin N-terminal helical domain-containing protein n=1 Tax=Aliiroseovarius sp. S253 TaxID=3415133 RepID=UPI003C7B2ED0